MEYFVEFKDESYPLKAVVMKRNLPFINHCHQEMEIILQEKGSLKVASDGEEFELKEGDICLIPPFKSHSIGTGSEGSERLAVLLDLRIMGSRQENQDEWLWIQKEIENLRIYSGEWEEETAEHMRRIVRDIYKEYVEKKYAWELAVKTRTNELLLLAVRKLPRGKEKKEKGQVARLKNILEYVALHYCEPITLGGCAEHAGFNPTYFSRFFSKYMGVTFQEYVKKLRIEKAKWLLMADEEAVTEICYQSGFRDVKTFNKLFKKECGMSPTRFRKTMKELKEESL